MGVQNLSSGAKMKAELKHILEGHHGRRSAITGRELARRFGQRDDRKIRLIIRELIAEGLPVASSTEPPAGYFLVETWQEVEEYAQSVRDRLINDALRRRDFRKAAAHYLLPAEQGRLI